MDVLGSRPMTVTDNLPPIVRPHKKQRVTFNDEHPVLKARACHMLSCQSLECRAHAVLANSDASLAGPLARIACKLLSLEDLWNIGTPWEMADLCAKRIEAMRGRLINDILDPLGVNTGVSLKCIENLIE